MPPVLEEIMTDVQGLACLLMTQPPAKRQKSVARICRWAERNTPDPAKFVAGTKQNKASTKKTYFRGETVKGFFELKGLKNRAEAKVEALKYAPTGYLLLTEHELPKTKGLVGKQVGRAVINVLP